MTNFIIGIIIAICVIAALFYIIKSKKQGKACIGCPSAGSCNKKCCCEEIKNSNK